VALFSGMLEAIADDPVSGSAPKGELSANQSEASADETSTASSGDNESTSKFSDFSLLTVAMMPSALAANFGASLTPTLVSGGDGNTALPREQLPGRGASSLVDSVPRPLISDLADMNPVAGSQPAILSSEDHQSEAARVLPALLAQEDSDHPVADLASERSGANMVADGLGAAAMRTLRTQPPEGVAVASLKLPAGSPEQWRPTLLEALGERIQVAVGKHSEHAVIRLDPPMMGSIEVIVRHQAGSLQVQLSATNNEVVRQLQGIGDNLRQELVQGQYTNVSVHVQADARNGGRQQQHAQQEATPGQALAEADEGLADQSFAFESA
jgi:flagellar hook-length control protein FliK